MASKILILGEEKKSRESLKLILGNHYNLILADKGEEVLAVLKNAEDVGLVLLDIKRPKINALELIKAIKEEFLRIKVLLTIGSPEEEVGGEAEGLGPDGYIQKPFNSEDILLKVRKNIG